MKLQVVYLQFTIYLFYEFDSKFFRRKIKCKDIKTGSVSPCNHFHMQTVLMTSRIVLQSVLKISVQKYSNAQIGLCCDVVHRGIMRPPLLFLNIYIYICPRCSAMYANFCVCVQRIHNADCYKFIYVCLCVGNRIQPHIGAFTTITFYQFVFHSPPKILQYILC